MKSQPHPWPAMERSECGRIAFCPEFSFAQSENELAVSDDEGVIAELSDWIGFGGDMCPEKNEEKWVSIWQRICKQKIQEAYQEYMHELKCSDDC